MRSLVSWPLFFLFIIIEVSRGQTDPVCDDCLNKGSIIFNTMRSPLMMELQVSALIDQLCPAPTAPGFDSCQSQIRNVWPSIGHVYFGDGFITFKTCTWLDRCDFAGDDGDNEDHDDAVQPGSQAQVWDCQNCRMWVRLGANTLETPQALVDSVEYLIDNCHRFNNTFDCVDVITNHFPSALPVVTEVMRNDSQVVCQHSFPDICA